MHVIIPARDEEAALPDTVAGLRQSLPAQVIVVDNGSRDGTGAVAGAAGATVVTEPEHGYGAACLAGLAHLADRPDRDIVAFFDADGSDDPALLAALTRPLREGTADLVLASRTLVTPERGALTLPQRVGNALACALIRWRWGTRFTDLAPCRALTLGALRRLHMRDRRFGWTVEMQIRAVTRGLRIREIPSRYRRRRAGRSKISGTVGGSLRAAVTILRVILREHRAA